MILNYRRISSLMLAIAIAVTSIFYVDFIANASEYKYTVLDEVNKTAELTAYSGFDETVEIPETIDGYKIVRIGTNAFRMHSEIKNLIIPNTVSELAREALGSMYFEKIVLPESLVIIGNRAFNNCTKLSDVVISDSVESIGDYAFSNCALKSVTIPKNVNYIGHDAFYMNYQLKNIFVNEENENFCDVDGVLHNKDKTKLIQFPTGSGKQSYTIVDSVKEIEEDAFSISNLYSVTFSKNLERIGKNAFCFNSNISELVLPDSLKTIDDSAFDNCTNLKKVYIGASLEQIGKRAFIQCSSVEKYSVSSDNQTYATSEGVLYNKLTNALIAYPSASKVSDYTVPSFITSIESNAFSYAYNLLYIRMKNVSTISEDAFYSCYYLREITFSKDYGKINGNIFFGCSSLSKFILLNPECEIPPVRSSITIRGYENSTAQEYASQKNVNFELIDDDDLYFLNSDEIVDDNIKIEKPEEPIPCKHTKTKTVIIKKATLSANGSQKKICANCEKNLSTIGIPSIKTLKLSKTTLTYNGKTLAKPTVEITDSKGNKISSSNYKISYISRSNGKTLSSIKYIGQYKVLVEFKNGYSGQKSLYFSVKPKNISISNLTTKSKSISAGWKTDTSVSGYQIVIATDSKFTKNKKTVLVSNKNTNKYSFKKLKKNKRYYIKVRSYKNITSDGKKAKMYSSYSSYKSIICK